MLSSRPRVLVVEDNDLNRTMLVRMLARTDAEVDAVANGDQALLACARSPYAVVLMDVQMPVMDGLEATRRIRALNLPAQPAIIGVSAHAFSTDVETGLDAGMDEYLAKPIRLDVLLSLVGKYLPQAC